MLLTGLRNSDEHGTAHPRASSERVLQPLDLLLPCPQQHPASEHPSSCRSLGRALPHPSPGPLSKHRPGCANSCGCAQGRVVAQLAFLEVTGDLLEKQEILGLPVYILTLLFLFSSRLSVPVSGHFKGISAPPSLSSLPLDLSFLPAAPVQCILFLLLCSLPPPPTPNHCCREEAGPRNHGHRCHILVML